MNPCPARLWVWRLSGAALVLLAGVLAAASSARAACGDYPLLARDSDSHGMPAGHGAQPMAHPQRSMPIDPAQGPRPCNGPNCSRGKLPLPMPAPSLSVSAEQWGAIASQISLD